MALTKEALLERAAALVPLLGERATHAETLRQLPPETVQALVSSGLIRIGNPSKYGGHDLDVDTIFEVCWELGRGCGSAAWCYSLWAFHAWLLGHFPVRAQEDVFSESLDPLICLSASVNIVGPSSVEPVEGGYRLSGRWKFVSACNSSNWAILSIKTEVVGVSQHFALLVPASDYKIIDTWRVSGLRATGSNDLVLDGAFVPTHRTRPLEKLGNGDWTGWEVHKRPSYRTPAVYFVGWELLSNLVGITQGMIDAFAKRLLRATGTRTATPSIPNQLRLAEAHAEVETARLIQRTAVNALFAGANGEGFKAAELTRYDRDRAFAAKLCVQAANRLFEGSSGSVIHESEPLQRLYRDAQAAARHAKLQWDPSAEAFARLSLGLP